MIELTPSDEDQQKISRETMRLYGLTPMMLGGTALPRVEAMAYQLWQLRAAATELQEQNESLTQTVGDLVDLSSLT